MRCAGKLSSAQAAAAALAAHHAWMELGALGLSSCLDGALTVNDKGGSPGGSESDVADARRRQEAAVELVAQAIATCRASSFACVHPEERPAMSEAFDTLIRQTVEGAGSAMTRFCEAEAEVARHKIHVQKVWFAEKLETARVAADVRARNSGAAAVAKASKEFEKKVERMADGGVEKELMRRVQEQAAELERLGLIEEESVLSKQRLASKEAELDKAQAAARQVAEDEKLCKGLMMRKAKRDLDVELSIEADLKEVVQDFVGTFSDKSRGAMDELRKLRVQFQELSANFALVERAGAEAAAAATCLAAELEEARQAEATAVERSTALELEVGELRRQLEATDAERHALGAARCGANGAVCVGRGGKD